MRYRVTGMRLGVLLMTPAGMVANGAIERRDHRDYLTQAGYQLEPCQGVPTPQPSDDDRRDMIAADKLLGIHRGESGVSKLQTDIAKGMREVLAPMRKSTYR